MFHRLGNSCRPTFIIERHLISKLFDNTSHVSCHASWNNRSVKFDLFCWTVENCHISSFERVVWLCKSATWRKINANIENLEHEQIKPSYFKKRNILQFLIHGDFLHHALHSYYKFPSGYTAAIEKLFHGFKGKSPVYRSRIVTCIRRLLWKNHFVTMMIIIIINRK